MLAGLPEREKRQFFVYAQHVIDRIKHRQLEQIAIARNEIESEVEDDN